MPRCADRRSHGCRWCAASVLSAAETATGPVAGYVAGRSATGTKTDSPLVETPASVSVVTRDQISDQGAQSVSQALRYTAGTFVDLRPPAATTSFRSAANRVLKLLHQRRIQPT
ncbi:hypothetical protein DNX69_11825 [Rhodopseudomonas palustris]|uniref:TonB-dependent receptor plug domain-containing protein n=1 Tax=Rhodopseudomonas palustris TaxID=1076 RepID=A0A323UI47_RHOPL|nr:hypothetical protein DNX69_11825 [Rhodopseudomonas palustris]